MPALDTQRELARLQKLTASLKRKLKEKRSERDEAKKNSTKQKKKRKTADVKVAALEASMALTEGGRAARAMDQRDAALKRKEDQL